ncbi:MAG: hypothetical protein R2717_09960 [Schumannella sp.]
MIADAHDHDGGLAALLDEPAQQGGSDIREVAGSEVPAAELDEPGARDVPAIVAVDETPLAQRTHIAVRGAQGQAEFAGELFDR